MPPAGGGSGGGRPGGGGPGVEGLGGEGIGSDEVGAEPTPEERAAMEAHMAELRQQLASTPAEVVVANHCFGLFELAALHLSLQPPHLEAARLAIDALGAVIEGLSGRLGDQEPTLKDGLAQLRLAFVQIHASSAGGGASGDAGAGGAGGRA